MTKQELMEEIGMYRKALENILNAEESDIVKRAVEKRGNEVKYPTTVGVMKATAEIALKKNYI